MSKKMKLRACKSILSSLLLCGMMTAVMAGEVEEKKICIDAPAGIWYVVVANNQATGESVKVPALAKKYLSAKSGDTISVKALWGKDIGLFLVGSDMGRVPLGGGLQCSGTVFNPSCHIISTC
jgi:hypothetical protein